MSPNPLRKLEALGQSVWLDFIEREFVRGGGIAKLIHEDGVSGVTSNPAIFHHAIAEAASYRAAVDELARAGLAAHEIHEAQVIEDIRDAAGALVDRPNLMIKVPRTMQGIEAIRRLTADEPHEAIIASLRARIALKG